MKPIVNVKKDGLRKIVRGRQDSALFAVYGKRQIRQTDKPLLNWVVASLSFQVWTPRRDHYSVEEMTALLLGDCSNAGARSELGFVTKHHELSLGKTTQNDIGEFRIRHVDHPRNSSERHSLYLAKS